ncbi:MAG TPA: TIGR01777 family oxidoreductase [Solirubrobacteraceae bacterium]|jgi:hypothetical protein|nr:TIGR01777 family oxidoreductase [Solirubrobacteraceae bacterium]
MRVAVTGASGLIGRRVVEALRARDDEVTVLSRDPRRGERWNPADEPAPAQALAGREAVVHLAGENIAQRWSASAKREIEASRVQGTRNLIAGLAALAADKRPPTLVSGSAIGYYGPHGDEPLDEETPAGPGFLAQTCAAWEAQANAAGELGLRVVKVRTGVVLDAAGGALAKMLPPFRLGVGGPIAGGRQYVPWIALEDVVGIVLAAIDGERWSGAVNATAPAPVRNAELAKALGRVLHRPALLPVPALALKALYGEMSEVVTTGARVMPARALMNGYEFRYGDVEDALRAALNGR